MNTIAKKTTKNLLAGLLALSLGWGFVGCQAAPTNQQSGGKGEARTEVEARPQAVETEEGEYAANALPNYAGVAAEETLDDPVDFNTEEYAAVDESGFIATATRTLSTFSSDVDTASYCNLRRMINRGYDAQDIPSGAIRTEELLNYFDYDYEPPSGSDLFSVTTQLGTCPWNDDTDLLVMGFATPSAEKNSKGRNLVFLIDCSGSMADANKLPLLSESFAKLIDKLDENDRVSLVTYSGSERILADGVSGNDRKTIMNAMNSIYASGATNGEAGLSMAYELAEENFIEGGVNRIILASDGDLNVGMSSTSDLNDYVSEKRETGIYLSVLGFGDGNYKDTKMETLADNGNGQYHYIDCIEEAERVFGEKLIANLDPLADDVKLQVEFNPSQVKAYRLIGYENRAMEDAAFEDEAADAGDIGPNSQFTVAYEIVPADSAMDIPHGELKYGNDASASDSDEWLTCTIRYKPVDGGNAEQQAIVSADDLLTDPGKDWEFAASVIECGMLLRDSEFAGSTSWNSVRELAAHSADDNLRKEFASLVESLPYNPKGNRTSRGAYE